MMNVSISEYQSRLKGGLEWEKFIIGNKFTHFVTFNFNFRETTDVESAKSKLAVFGMKINRKLHGQNFHKKTAEKRTSFIAFVEHINSNLHYHAALTTADINGFNANAESIWKEIVASGSLHVEHKNFSNNDIQKIAHYITKDCFLDINSQHSFFFS